MIAIQTSARNGNVVAATLVDARDEIMLITTGGVLIRTRVSEIREMSRATQGVTLINLGPDEKLAGLQKIVDSEEGVESLEAGAGDEMEGDAGQDTVAGLPDNDSPEPGPGEPDDQG
jgi:DNA gyrase subunit A